MANENPSGKPIESESETLERELYELKKTGHNLNNFLEFGEGMLKHYASLKEKKVWDPELEAMEKDMKTRVNSTREAIIRLRERDYKKKTLLQKVNPASNFFKTTGVEDIQRLEREDLAEVEEGESIVVKKD